MNELEIRHATPSDTPAILETLRRALGETPLLRRTEALWNWKHFDNPFGKSIVLLAVSPEGRVAGVRALMRWELAIGDQTIRCVRAVDTATHPEFTRRGIFRSLTEHAVDQAATEGVDLIFNTPNEKSGAGYIKMGWAEVGWIGVQARPRIGRSVQPSDEEAPSIAEWLPQRSPVPTEAGSEHDDRARRQLATPTTPAYLRWRFHQHPTASYGFVQYDKESGLVVRASSRKGRSELVASAFLGQARSGAVRRTVRMMRARYLAGWFSPGSPERRAAILGGLVPLPGIKTLRLVCRPLTDLGVDPFDMSSWRLGTGDLELL